MPASAHVANWLQAAACASSSRPAASSASALRCSTSMLQTRMH